MTTDVAVSRKLHDAVPVPVRSVCARLRDAGFQTVTVGGAVRDVLLGREVGDWDVATAARPADVVAVFPRTIPTGIQHGTVTVMMGSEAIEVTTFRGEGAYTDARRPDHVVFGVPLVEDLARRDLVVNAMAFDPATGELHDPFGGLADLAATIARRELVALARLGTRDARGAAGALADPAAAAPPCGGSAGRCMLTSAAACGDADSSGGSGGGEAGECGRGDSGGGAESTAVAVAADSDMAVLQHAFSLRRALFVLEDLVAHGRRVAEAVQPEPQLAPLLRQIRDVLEGL